ncbi:uncharacterized protein LOC121375559 isoform X2 [Gigantopelta aegis]|nr:uncharacterized protein LOC121375559 isoform X2 [Gigantopelta aegis]XP_041359000.1 uncharacterized protein LOC121375559 isoform X2 [Gigantopelta aegis]
MKCYRYCCCRVRSKHQRRRLFVWLGTLGFVLCLLYYNNELLARYEQQQQRQEQKQQLNSPVVEQGRKPMAVNAGIPHAFDNDDSNDLDLLPDLAPAVLHYIWCGNRVFEFRHYLALKSAHRAVKPDKVFFHYEKLPLDDEQGYYQWFNETLRQIDHLLPRPLNQSVCPQSGTAERYILVLDLLEQFGGIYVPEDSIWVDFPVHLRSSPIVSGVLPVNPSVYEDGIIVAKKRAFKKPISHEEMLITLSLGKHEHGELKPCADESAYNTDTNGHTMCVRIRKELFPKDIWNMDTKLGVLARVVAYGTTTVHHKHNLKTPIPKIAHYTCIDCNLKFSSYLSMLSSVFVAGLKKVYLHGVQTPSGPWWALLVKDPRFVFVYREYPETLYDKAVMSRVLALAVMRADILLKYGGVYQDHNVLWTQRIPEFYFGYEAVASPHWHLYGHWPDSVNHGTLMLKRNSRYMIKVREIMQRNQENPHWFNDQFLSYKIIERHPELVKFDRHFQVICLNHNCHPTWQRNYKSGLMQNRPGDWFKWQNDTLSIYWIDTFPELNVDMVKYTSGTIVEVSRHILQSADVDLNNL